MLYNPFNFQSNDNWDTDGLYWYNEFYTKKLVWTSLNQFHGLQKTGPRWSGSVPAISGSVLDRLRSMVAHSGGKKPDWTGLANTRYVRQGLQGESAGRGPNMVVVVKRDQQWRPVKTPEKQIQIEQTRSIFQAMSSIWRNLLLTWSRCSTNIWDLPSYLHWSWGCKWVELNTVRH